ncbi:hypothetical protein [Streptomyces chrestomyceticus]|uniref:GNAT family N-acetyltransferase n=1 Tax=Streptomyces chrestomyceticus TaxID=68185 RepID=A0ABU7WQR1_9ACTN
MHSSFAKSGIPAENPLDASAVEPRPLRITAVHRQFPPAVSFSTVALSAPSLRPGSRPAAAPDRCDSSDDRSSRLSDIDSRFWRRSRGVVAEQAECEAGEEQAFRDVDRFAERADMYASLDGWCAVLGRTGDSGGGVTGYAFGAPLPAGSGWWNSAADPLPEDFTDEDGQRTFAVFAVMVRRPWRGTGEAHRLSEWLLHGRPEQRATLLVDASHPGCGGATSTGATTLSATGSPSPAPRSAR